MSMNALMLATKSHLQTQLIIDADPKRDFIVDITEDGRPKPASGKLFIGIVGKNISNQTRESLEEYYSLDIVVTLNAGIAPHNLLGREVLNKIFSFQTGTITGGLWAISEQIRVWIHMNYALMDIANNTHIGPDATGFRVPLMFSSMNYRGVVGPEWFFGEGEQNPPSGVVMDIHFTNAYRPQKIEDMT